MPKIEPIVPTSLELLQTQRGYSPGVRLGSTLLISGMLGRKTDLNIVADPEAQLVQLFENMGAVLAEAGCDWTDLAELTGYFTHLQRDYDLFMTVRDRYVREPYPAQTMIGVAELAQPGLICEVKGIAVLPGPIGQTASG